MTTDPTPQDFAIVLRVCSGSCHLSGNATEQAHA